MSKPSTRNRLLALSVFALLGCRGGDPYPLYGQLEKLSRFPAGLSEVSGIAYMGGKHVWVIEDSGNKDEIYAIRPEDGELVRKFKVSDAKNRDWEDLAQDDAGHLYIADMGNNDNRRKNLVVYKLPDPEREKGDKIKAKAIRFRYADQKKFPPKKSRRNFDAEALFHLDGHLYIVTKNRTEPFDGVADFYRIPDQPGDHIAEQVDSFVPCTEHGACHITAAALSPDGKTLALLGYGSVWLFTDFVPGRFSEGTVRQIDLDWRTQQESIVFRNDRQLYIADERSQTRGRNLYLLDLDQVEARPLVKD